MDFVAEIVSLAQEASRMELNELASETCSKIINMKHSIKAGLEESYVNLLPLVKNNSSLITEASSLKDCLEAIQKQLEDKTKGEVESVSGDLTQLKERLEEASATVGLCEKLLAIDRDLDLAKKALEDGRLAQGVERLSGAERLLDRDCEDLDCLDIYRGMANHLLTWKDQVMTDTLKNWRGCVAWDVQTVGGRTKKVCLKVCSKRAQTGELFRALHLMNADDREVKTLADNLLTDVLKPVVLSKTEVGVAEKGEHAVLSISIDVKSKKPDYATTMAHLAQVFQFLRDYLSVEADGNVSLLGSVGGAICTEFLETLVEECLSNTIPLKKEELAKYEETQHEIKAFETQLKELGFTSDERVFESYYSNLEELFARKSKERHLVAARDLMKRDLHDMKQVGLPPAEGEEESVDKDLGLPDLSMKIFQFPYCKISQSAEDLLSLVRKMLGEVGKSEDKLAATLYYTARDIFTMYIDIVPVHHRRILESIPQQAAILHNNLMYLAHEMMTLDLEFRHSYPPLLQGQTTTFVDFVYPMRTRAVKALDEQVTLQNRQILNIVRDSGLSELSQEERVPGGVEKGLRQCVRQLFLLQSVWQCVLPVNIYTRIMAHLVNNLVEELIAKVISTKDITEKAATDLVAIFTVAMQEIPTVFPEAKEVGRLVKSWSKLSELVRVLGGSLVEIAERWADGKGPLAAEFTPEQARNLVRALFQVSDRRAALLARIV